ncbi:AAA family ATPase [Psychrobacter sp. APC 3350]|uniref:AAA family ATPase n=1 Tax=Psychrobacter sp. APC 3350 TaxID=3035195 RepID=UPI0025B3029F|nr:AAA family ATPase [Psychrobacter sp. APC 3350]MDN3454524.1 AAA family ATPase [Psychrobacter sp. APC 3350]
MLIYIRFNNFYSFLNEAELSFSMGKKPSKSAYDVNVTTTQDELRLNKVIAVLGANGSGKTQLLKSLSFLVWFISRSTQNLEHNEDIPFSPFVTNKDDISEFEIGFAVLNEFNVYQEYRYELTLLSQKVKREALYKKTSSSFSYVFERLYQDGKMSYKHRGFLKPSLADDIGANSSLISYGSLLDNPIAMQMVDFLKGFDSNVTSNGRVTSAHGHLTDIAELLSKDEYLKKQAEEMLCQFDTGISEIRFKNILAVYNDQSKEEVLIPVGVHLHGDSEFEMLFFEESNGTQSALVLLGSLLVVLGEGGVAVIDEMDNDLHPHLLPIIIDLFKSEETNPHNAQLIFSCHTPEVFNILNKHQLYLVEKYDQESETWRLDEVDGVRSDENLYAKYMAGAFEAVPNV